MLPCDVKALYWRDGVRWQIVLQVMYYTDERCVAGEGPFFVLGYTCSERGALARVRKENDRLATSAERVAERVAERGDAA